MSAADQAFEEEGLQIAAGVETRPTATRSLSTV